MIINVIKLFTDILKDLYPAKAKKPIAISGINLKKFVLKLKWLKLATRKEKAPIKQQAGKIQITNVITASGTPPLLYPIKVSVWVEDAPGSIWQKETYSINSSFVTSFLRSTKVRSIIPKCPWGPPKAVILCKNTAFKNGICLLKFSTNNHHQILSIKWDIILIILLPFHQATKHLRC